ncbi:hypothetical protein [Marinomonas epiphytica]
MPQVSTSDALLIKQLHHLVFEDQATKALIEEGFQSALAIFEQPDYELPYASFNLPIESFLQKLTADQSGKIGLCRVFILRAGCKMPRPEIHRNSIQRLVSYSGEGSIFSAKPGGIDRNFQGFSIASPDSQSKDKPHWDIVPENTWHYPLAGVQEDWFTVTFHSASEALIIDEYWQDG